MPTLKREDVRLHYVLEGVADGPIVMLSNSLSSRLSMWEGQVPALLAAGYRVLRYDTRGHGQSSAPNGPYSIAMLVDDALSLMDTVKAERVHFCGLSLGGMTGQWLGTHHADRLHTLTLCATTAYTGPPQVWADRIAMVERDGMAAVADATIDRWFTPQGQQRLPHAIADIRASILATPPAGYIGCGQAIMAMDQRETIAAIRTPTHVMVGADDPSTPVSASEFLQQRIPGARLTVVPEAMHLFNVEQAAAFNAALLGFLGPHRTGKQ